MALQFVLLSGKPVVVDTSSNLCVASARECVARALSLPKDRVCLVASWGELSDEDEVLDASSAGIIHTQILRDPAEQELVDAAGAQAHDQGGGRPRPHGPGRRLYAPIWYPRCG